MVRQADAKSLLASWSCGKSFGFSERPYLKVIGRKQEKDTWCSILVSKCIHTHLYTDVHIIHAIHITHTQKTFKGQKYRVQLMRRIDYVSSPLKIYLLWKIVS